MKNFFSKFFRNEIKSNKNFPDYGTSIHVHAYIHTNDATIWKFLYHDIMGFVYVHHDNHDVLKELKYVNLLIE